MAAAKETLRIAIVQPPMAWTTNENVALLVIVTNARPASIDVVVKPEPAQ